MYPNFNAEYARKGLTLEKLAEELKKHGIERTISTLSLKLNGRYGLSLYEAKALKAIVESNDPLDVLFEEA